MKKPLPLNLIFLHFGESEDANVKSKLLADLVMDFLKENGVKPSLLKVHYVGDKKLVIMIQKQEEQLTVE